MSSFSSNAGMEKSAPLINAIVDNDLFHSNSHINQRSPQIIHILHFSGRLTAPDFVMKCTEVRAVLRTEILMSIWVSYIIALSDWRP